jgi:hypothetical protein
MEAWEGTTQATVLIKAVVRIYLIVIRKHRHEAFTVYFHQLRPWKHDMEVQSVIFFIFINVDYFEYFEVNLFFIPISPVGYILRQK